MSNEEKISGRFALQKKVTLHQLKSDKLTAYSRPTQKRTKGKNSFTQVKNKEENQLQTAVKNEGKDQFYTKVENEITDESKTKGNINFTQNEGYDKFCTKSKTK